MYRNSGDLLGAIVKSPKQTREARRTTDALNPPTTDTRINPWSRGAEAIANDLLRHIKLLAAHVAAVDRLRSHLDAIVRRLDTTDENH